MSITGFDEQTHDLREYETQTLVPALCKILSRCEGIDKRKTIAQLTTCLKSDEGIDYKGDGARVRKMINVIRRECRVPWLIASSSGYWVASSREDLELYIAGLRHRGQSILAVADALEQQAEEYTQVRCL